LTQHGPHLMKTIVYAALVGGRRHATPTCVRTRYDNVQTFVYVQT
jgi:hypothetical protein